MSSVPDSVISQPSHPENRPGSQRRLSEPEKQSIIAQVALGKSQTQAALDFGVHRNTVWALCQPVKDLPGSPLDKTWRTRMTDELPALAVNAMQASMEDREDVHRAASTGIALLKGIGALASDNATTLTVSVFAGSVANLPADWQERYVTSVDAIDAASTDD